MGRIDGLLCKRSDLVEGGNIDFGSWVAARKWPMAWRERVREEMGRLVGRAHEREREEAADQVKQGRVAEVAAMWSSRWQEIGGEEERVRRSDSSRRRNVAGERRRAGGRGRRRRQKKEKVNSFHGSD